MAAGNMRMTKNCLNLAYLLCNFTIGIQNCNSLNVSTSCPKQLKKICAISSMDCDIIFLSDLRLNNNSTVVKDLENVFLTAGNRQYIFFHNSTMNKRGVGILITQNLGLVVIDEFRDTDENILALHVKINNCDLLLVSIYGPNKNCDIQFFKKLNDLLESFPDTPTIIGGDWNCTLSCDPTEYNIDTHKMKNPPSITRSLELGGVCLAGGLSDPFRALHPTLRDFSYRPSDKGSNRSRIDFFLISDPLIDCVSSCNISTELLTELFDHNCVKLCLNKTNIRTNVNVNNLTLLNPLSEYIIAGAVFDTYAAHLNPNFQGVNSVELELKVGQLLSTIKEINDIDYVLAGGGEGTRDPTHILLTSRKDKIDSLVFLLSTLPTADELALYELSCNDDVFLEVLMGNIKNSLVSFQSFLRKIKRLKTNNLCKKINNLRRDGFLINNAEIAALERELDALVEIELKEKVCRLKTFECLNSERATPLFLSLTKARNRDSLSSIQKNKTTKFESKNEREEFIVNYFRNIYKKPDCPKIDADCIEEFLGTDILNSDIVKDSRLTENERNLLDLPLTIDELDKSIKGANMKSAPGTDGFSNQLIKRCWNFLRRPTLKYVNCCMAKGLLTDNFRTAAIRLIPKKGDVSDISNWRPISLLSNMYKLISRAINNRLKTIANRICSRAQKGFNQNKFTQEVLINIIETISSCNNVGKTGILMAIDMAKAFDTVSHDFMEAVFSFFGFGTYFTNLLTLVGKNRQAGILLDNGILSQFFKLERGRPQGDTISPITFNFAIQILIFKLELTPKITKISINRKIANLAPATHDYYSHEQNRKTEKN